VLQEASEKRVLAVSMQLVHKSSSLTETLLVSRRLRHH
jgi:hypothetical protein